MAGGPTDKDVPSHPVVDRTMSGEVTQPDADNRETLVRPVPTKPVEHVEPGQRSGSPVAGDDEAAFRAELAATEEPSITQQLEDDYVEEVAKLAKPPPLPPSRDVTQVSQPAEDQLESPTVLERAQRELEAGVWGRRAQALAAQLETMEDRKRAAAIAYELGELYERRLADEGRAVKAYSRALQADPSLRSNLWAIRRVFQRRALWPNLIKLLDAELRFARNDSDRAALHVEQGVIWEDRVGDLHNAKSEYEKALVADNACVEAALGLERVGASTGDNALLSSAWRALADISEHPEQRVSYLVKHAHLLAEQDDGPAQSLALLDEACKLGVELDRITRARVRIAQSADEPALLVDALERRAQWLSSTLGGSDGGSADPAPEAPGQKDGTRDITRREIVGLRRQQARVARYEQKDANAAWSYLQQALALAPGEALVLADLADVAEELGKFEELAQLCEGWESAAGDGLKSMGLSIRRASAMLHSDSDEQARVVIESLEALAPGYVPVVALRERYALKTGDYEALGRAYVALAEAMRNGTSLGQESHEPEAATAVSALIVAGEIFAYYAENPQEAEACYRMALDWERGSAVAVDALVALQEQRGELDKAMQTLVTYADTGDEQFREVCLHRRVWFADRLGDRDIAIAALQELVATRPRDTVLMWRLEEQLMLAQRHEERAERLVALGKVAVDSTEQARALLVAARLYIHELNRPEAAIDVLQSVRTLAPADTYARAALSRLLRWAERWEDLVGVLLDPAVPDDNAAQAMREAAHVLRSRLGDASRAVAVLRDLNDRAPNPYTVRELAAALEDHGDYSALTEVLEREASSIMEPHARAFAYVRLGWAQEQADRPSDALESYRTALEAHPELMCAAVAMDELALRLSQPEARVQALTALAQGVRDVELRSELFEEAGWVHMRELDDVDSAAQMFHQAADGGSQRHTARVFATLVHAKRGDQYDLGDALAELGKALPDVPVACALTLRAATIAEVAGDPELGYQRVAAAVDAAQDARNLVVASEYLPADAAEHLSAYDTDDEALSQLLQRAELCRLRADVCENPAAREAWQLDQADALAAAGQLRKAGEIVAGVLTSQPRDVRALEAWRSMSERGGHLAGVATASVALAQVLGGKDVKLKRLREAAAAFSELGDVSSLVAVYREILQLEAGADEFEALCAVYREHEDVGGLIPALTGRLDWLAERPGSEAERADLLVERGRLRRTIGDDAGAKSDVSAALRDESSHPDGLREMASLVLQQGDHEQAADLLRRFVQNAPNGEHKTQAELTLSEILADNMDDLAGAIGQLESLVSRAPTEVAARERLISLLVRVGSFGKAAAQLGDLADSRDTDAARARDYLRIAEITRHRMGDLDGARAALQKARTLDPLDLDAIRESAELAAASGSEQARTKLLSEAAADIRETIADDPMQAAHYERLAVVAEWLEDADARYLALGALACAGSLSSEQRRFVQVRQDALSIDVLSAGKTSLSSGDWQQRLRHREAGGVAFDIWQVIAEGMCRGAALEPAKLGFSKNDRVSSRQLGKSYPLIGGMAALCGLDNFDLYVSRSKQSYGRVVDSGKPVLLLSQDVAQADSAGRRFQLGRVLALARDRMANLVEFQDEQIELLFAGAASAAEVRNRPAWLDEVIANHAEDVAARARLLKKHMPRRDRKALQMLAARFGELKPAGSWRRGVIGTASRVGLLLSGDIEVALEMLNTGATGRSLRDDREALQLLAWSVGGDHIALRTQLGMCGER